MDEGPPAMHPEGDAEEPEPPDELLEDAGDEPVPGDDSPGKPDGSLPPEKTIEEQRAELQRRMEEDDPRNREGIRRHKRRPPSDYRHFG